MDFISDNNQMKITIEFSLICLLKFHEKYNPLVEWNSTFDGFFI